MAESEDGSLAVTYVVGGHTHFCCPDGVARHSGNLQPNALECMTGVPCWETQHRLSCMQQTSALQKSFLQKPVPFLNSQAPMSGEYKITMSIGPSAVAGSPFRVPCQQPRPSDAESTVDLRNGHGFVDEPYTAVVTVRDQFGRRWAANFMSERGRWHEVLTRHVAHDCCCKAHPS